jgi:hypothetical protein
LHLTRQRNSSSTASEFRQSQSAPTFYANVSTPLRLYAQSANATVLEARDIDAESDFAKRLERGKLTFTGDVLQV